MAGGTDGRQGAAPENAEVPYRTVLGAAALWIPVALLLTAVFTPGPGTAVGWLILTMWLVLCAIGASWPTRLVARRRGWSELWRLALVAAPAFWFFRAIVAILERMLS